jgi:hypothetical protein
MIDGNKFAIVLEDHDLVLGVTICRVFPIINGYFDSFGAVFAWNMKYATSWCVLVQAFALRTHTIGIIYFGIRGC